MGGNLDILDWMLNWDSSKPKDVKFSVKEFIRNHDYKVLQWFLDHGMLKLRSRHMEWVMNLLSDDPELIPMLCWIMKRAPWGPKAFNEKSRASITEEAIQSLRIDVIHWLHAKGILYSQVKDGVLMERHLIPHNLEYAICLAANACCYHLLRTLHDLKVWDLSQIAEVLPGTPKNQIYCHFHCDHENGMCKQTQGINYTNPHCCNSCAENQVLFIGGSDLGKTNPPPVYYCFSS